MSNVVWVDDICFYTFFAVYVGHNSMMKLYLSVYIISVIIFYYFIKQRTSFLRFALMF